MGNGDRLDRQARGAGQPEETGGRVVAPGKIGTEIDDRQRIAEAAHEIELFEGLPLDDHARIGPRADRSGSRADAGIDRRASGQFEPGGSDCGGWKPFRIHRAALERATADVRDFKLKLGELPIHEHEAGGVGIVLGADRLLAAAAAHPGVHREQRLHLDHRRSVDHDLLRLDEVDDAEPGLERQLEAADLHAADDLGVDVGELPFLDHDPGHLAVVAAKLEGDLLGLEEGRENLAGHREPRLFPRHRGLEIADVAESQALGPQLDRTELERRVDRHVEQFERSVHDREARSVDAGRRLVAERNLEREPVGELDAGGPREVERLRAGDVGEPHVLERERDLLHAERARHRHIEPLEPAGDDLNAGQTLLAKLEQHTAVDGDAGGHVGEAEALAVVLRDREVRLGALDDECGLPGEGESLRRPVVDEVDVAGEDLHSAEGGVEGGQDVEVEELSILDHEPRHRLAGLGVDAAEGA